MVNKRSSEPAAPSAQATESATQTQVTEQHEGLTKRETGAIAAMQGLLASGATSPASEVARDAVDHADALFAELGKDGGK